MVTWAALLAAMAGVYLLEGPRLTIRVSGGVHEFVVLTYALITALVAVDQRPRTACGMRMPSGACGDHMGQIATTSVAGTVK